VSVLLAVFSLAPWLLHRRAAPPGNTSTASPGQPSPARHRPLLQRDSPPTQPPQTELVEVLLEREASAPPPPPPPRASPAHRGVAAARVARNATAAENVPTAVTLAVLMVESRCDRRVSASHFISHFCIHQNTTAFKKKVFTRYETRERDIENEEHTTGYTKKTKAPAYISFDCTSCRAVKSLRPWLCFPGGGGAGPRRGALLGGRVAGGQARAVGARPRPGKSKNDEFLPPSS
jgi:hypothetical protein